MFSNIYTHYNIKYSPRVRQSARHIWKPKPYQKLSYRRLQINLNRISNKVHTHFKINQSDIQRTRSLFPSLVSYLPISLPFLLRQIEPAILNLLLYTSFPESESSM